MAHPADPDAELRKVITRGGAVIVAGTGVSMAATWDASTQRFHPEASWVGLLENGLEWLKQKNLISPEEAGAHVTFLKSNRPCIHHFVSAAQDVTRLMGGAKSLHFSEWLTRTIGSITAHDRQGLDALHSLRRHGNLLATTNYDGLLLDEADSLKPVTWKEPDAFLRAAHDKDVNKIIFLHGFWRQPRSVILDWDSYQQIARDEPYRDKLATVWQMTTWLYVGCGVNGLNDPDFGLLLERYGKRARNADLWDFCLVRSNQREEFQSHFDKLQVNICAVSFGDSYDQLPGYLLSLLPAVTPAKPAVTVVAHPPVEPITEFLRVTDKFFQYRSPAVPATGVSSGSRGDFRFTEAEFRAGAVHRARVVDVALSRLRRDGCVWLEGPSAGGKTTVCLHLVSEWNHQGYEPLFLDLADETDAGQAAREIATHAKLGRMFILDNVHAAPKLACALLDQWNSQRRDSVMVLLGWPADVHPGPDYLSGYRSAVVPVAVQPEDWIGVYQSTFRRIRGPGHVPPVPPADAVREWDDAFAADLVTFQYSLAAGLRSGLGSDFQIERAAADPYVREKYLEPCSPQERADLFRLGWFADMTLAIDKDLVPSLFKHSVSCGLVRAKSRGRLLNRIRFLPWHRSFARLLVGLAETPDRKASLTQAAISFPPVVGWLLQRLCERKENELAKLVIEEVLDAHSSLADWFGDSLSIAVSLFQNVREHSPMRWHSAIERINEADELLKLANKALSTPLGDLVSFLRFTQQSKELKPVQVALFKALVADAKLPADQSRLQARAFATPLHFLVSFLQFTGQSKELKPVQNALFKALVGDAKLPADQSRLQAQAFATPLHLLVTFVRFTQQSQELQPVQDTLFKVLVADAKLPADQSRLQAQALATPLHFLVTFLQFTGQNEELKPVQDALFKVLVGDAKLPADQSRLQAQAFATPLHLWGKFLQFTWQSEELKPVQDALVRALAADAKLPVEKSRLMRIARITKYENLRGFINAVKPIPEFAALVQMIERDGDCAKVLRTKVNSRPPLPAEVEKCTQTPAIESKLDLPASGPQQIRILLELRIQVGIERVLREAWEAVPEETPEGDRFKTARRKATEVISGLSPHVKRQVGAHFLTKNWEPLKERDPKR
jgi:hypothetical protein